MFSSAPKQRVVLGVVVTGQTVALVFVVLVVGALIGAAMLSWLERLG